MSCMFLDDVIRSIFEISLAPRARLQRHAYNLHGFHFTAQQLGDKLKQIFPGFEYSFEVLHIDEMLFFSNMFENDM